NLQPADATRLHPRNAFLPPLDDPAERERDRLTAIHAAIELRAVGQPAGVVNRHRAAGLDRLALTFLRVPDLQPRRKLLPLRGIYFRHLHDESPWGLPALLRFEQLDLEHEHGIGRDVPDCSPTRRSSDVNPQPAHAARLHPRNAFLPPLDELVQRELGL